MRSKCISSTSCRKSVTGNWFSDIDLLYDVEILAVRRCFLPILAIFLLRMRSFDDITTYGLKYYVIFEFSTPVSL